MQSCTFVIVGGGTTGWLLGLYLVRRYPRAEYPGVQVVLVESPNIATIGVGEGTFPTLRETFRILKIDDVDWMASCEATYKLGIEFVGWGREPRFFHAFYQGLHNDVAHYFDAARNGSDFVDCRFVDKVDQPRLDQFKDTLFYRCPRRRVKMHTGLAYHFNAGLLADYMKNRAIALGLDHRVGTVTRVERYPDGAIRRLYLNRGPSLAADYFLDCSGFHAVLAEKTLAVPFQSQDQSLLCDSALATHVPQNQPHAARERTHTTSICGRAGWFWQIPLSGKDGCGYVYSSGYLSELQAIEEFQAFLKHSYGISVLENDIGRVKFKTGRRQQSWQHNCVSFGLANNFVEPLEATAIGMTSIAIARFLSALSLIERDGDVDRHRQAYNQWGLELYDEVRDFLVAHYRTAARNDTPFWLANHHETLIPESLESRLELWRHSRQIPVGANLRIPAASWFSILVGNGYGF